MKEVYRFEHKFKLNKRKRYLSSQIVEIKKKNRTDNFKSKTGKEKKINKKMFMKKWNCEYL